MAAIDKLYVSHYYEYDELRRWAMAYYPELLFYFIDITMTDKQWEDDRKSYVNRRMNIAKNDYKKLVEYCKCSGDRDDMVAARYKEWKSISVPGATLERAGENVDDILKRYNMTQDEWEDSYVCPIMNMPFEVDRRLLWTCPVPCVREYLKTNCGFETRWYHKMFFRGKKYFC